VKYQVIYRDGRAEIHGKSCRDILWADYEGDDMVDAANPYGAAVDAWAHESPGGDAYALEHTVFLPCLAERARPTVEIPKIGMRDSLDRKIDVTRAWAEEHGWDVVDRGQSLELSRDAEFIVAVWELNAWDSVLSAWTMDSYSLRLGSLADALRRIAGHPADVIEAAEEPRRRRQKRPTRRNIPFGLDDDEDEILDAVVGGTLVWVNSFSGEEETAVIPPDSSVDAKGVEKIHNRHLKISTSSTGRRILMFVDYMGTGFRSVALDALVAVK